MCLLAYSRVQRAPTRLLAGFLPPFCLLSSACLPAFHLNPSPHHPSTLAHTPGSSPAANMTCMYSALLSAAAPTCRMEAVTEEAEEEELAYKEEASFKSRLVRRRTRRGQEGTGGGQLEEEEMWEGMVWMEIKGGAEEVWEMVSRFGNMKRWNANAEVCEVVEGAEDEPGCVRYCAGGGRAADGSPLRWVREKLLALYPAQRCFTYCILDSSYGFQGYTATLAIRPIHGEPGRALAHWCFQLQPVPHTLPPHLLSFLTSTFHNMMCSLERSILPPPPLHTGPPNPSTVHV